MAEGWGIRQEMGYWDKISEWDYQCGSIYWTKLNAGNGMGVL